MEAREYFKAKKTGNLVKRKKKRKKGKFGKKKKKKKKGKFYSPANAEVGFSVQ